MTRYLGAGSALDAIYEIAYGVQMLPYNSHNICLLAVFRLRRNLSAGFFVGQFFLAPAKPDINKNAPYECGLKHLRTRAINLTCGFICINSIYYFDLEIAFLFPWAITLGHTGYSDLYPW